MAEDTMNTDIETVAKALDGISEPTVRLVAAAAFRRILFVTIDKNLGEMVATLRAIRAAQENDVARVVARIETCTSSVTESVNSIDRRFLEAIKRNLPPQNPPTPKARTKKRGARR